MKDLDKIELLHKTLVSANKLLHQLGNKYCRDKAGFLNEKGIAVWDAEIDVSISRVLAMIEKENSEEKEWLFNFIGGGWNSVYAKNKQEAYLKANERYMNDKTLKVDHESFRINTPDDYSSLMAMFN